jgi:hypothetical protein
MSIEPMNMLSITSDLNSNPNWLNFLFNLVISLSLQLMINGKCVFLLIAQFPTCSNLSFLSSFFLLLLAAGFI